MLSSVTPGAPDGAVGSVGLGQRARPALWRSDDLESWSDPQLLPLPQGVGGTQVNGDAEHAKWLADTMGIHNHQVVFGPDHVPTPEAWRRLGTSRWTFARCDRQLTTNMDPRRGDP